MSSTTPFGGRRPRDSTPSTSDIIRSLSAKESQMMKRIRDEISVFVKTRWH
jgi:hypothetical protein